MADMTQEEKDQELYKASLPAFFMNEIETDKIILTLSVGAIGFYSALLTGESILLTDVMNISMVLAVILYGVTTAMVIGVFAQNKKQLISIISNNGKADENPKLTFLDEHKYKPFISAIFFSIVFMLALMYNNINKKEPTVSNQNQEHNNSGTEELKSSNEGFSGVTTANTKGTTKAQQVDINKTTPDNNSSDTNKSK
ncbi:MAG: hypothetical protein GQ570_14155 [Helicobacteraceae bacterium]|nr:hypothetical protein [Helicobacteraceae bacterium]